MSYNSPFDHGSWQRPVYRAGVSAFDVDLGLRRYMLQVYNYMAAGLAVTGLVAYAAVTTGFYQQVAGTPLIWLIMLAPLGAVLFLSFRRLPVACPSEELEPAGTSNSMNVPPDRGKIHAVSMACCSAVG